MLAGRLSPRVLSQGTQHLRRVDGRLAPIIDQVGPCMLRPRNQIYRSLFRAVLYQQLAGKAAAAIERRLCAPFGGRIPAPDVFLRTADAPLLAAGLSRQKLSYLRDVATGFAEGRLRPQTLARLPDDDVVTAVTALRGIGQWTAHMLLIFSLGRPDVLPVGDYGVRKDMQRLYRLRNLPDPHTMERLAAPWRPYRTIGSWYIWRSSDVVTL